MQLKVYICIQVFLVGMLGGIWAAKLGGIQWYWLLVVAAIMLVMARRVRFGLLVAAALGGMAFGVGRSQPILNQQQLLGSYVGQTVNTTGRVVSDPIYHSSGQLEFMVAELQCDTCSNTSINATLKVRAFSRQLVRGDTVRLQGKLYDGYAYWQGSMHFAELTVLANDSSVVQNIRKRFMTNIYSVMPDPEASLGLGFLIGVRSLLPKSLTEQLSITGLSHIVAVSGYNLTILATASKRLLGKRGSRFQSVLLSLSLMLFFVAITGPSPSIVRALIVSVISLAGWYYGKSPTAWQLLLYSSAISAAWRPSYVWYELGWYLSLLAFAGVLVLAPLIKQRLYGTREPRLLMQIAIETTAAQLATLPFIMAVFGQVSLVSMLANMVVLPLIPLCMLLVFLVGSVYFASSTAAWLLMWPAYVLMSFIVQCVVWFASFDWAQADWRFSSYQAWGAYAVLAVATFGLRKHARQSGIMTPIQVKFTQWENSIRVRTLKMGQN